MPLYFKAFENEEIIVANDALNDKKTAELFEFYLKPLDIQSLMDIPIRIEGQIIGVVCFENVGKPREWTYQEQKYGLVTAQMISLAIESNNKQKVKQELEIALNEKNVLLQEVNHRVKNNLSIVASLMNLQSEKSNDDYHKQLFMECRNRLESISSVHELVYKTKSYAHLNFKEYLIQIIQHIADSYKSSKNIVVTKNISDVHVDISSAIPLALIVNELITNAYKHAFSNQKNGNIEITLSEQNKEVFLTIKDNGKGFDKNIIPTNSIGMDILNGLVDQIDGVAELTSNEKGTSFKISFSKK
jgi:two-component sensor histidine kinase